jgi:hypothetical protein
MSLHPARFSTIYSWGRQIEDVDHLLQVLQAEGWRADSDEEDADGLVEPNARHVELVGRPRGAELQQSLAIYLATQRGLLTLICTYSLCYGKEYHVLFYVTCIVCEMDCMFQSLVTPSNAVKRSSGVGQAQEFVPSM